MKSSPGRRPPAILPARPGGCCCSGRVRSGGMEKRREKKEKIPLIIVEKAETPPLAGAAQAAKALRCGVPGRRDGEECVGVWGGGGGGAAGEMPRSCWRRPRRGTGRTRGGGLGSPCPALPCPGIPRGSQPCPGEPPALSGRKAGLDARNFGRKQAAA